MSPLAHITSALVRFYQVVISPLTGPSCRYHPTCSHYAIQAIKRHGALAGCWLAARRILRCAPWGGSGIDHVPAQFSWLGRRPKETPEHNHCGCAHAHEADIPASTIPASTRTSSRTSK